MTTPLDVRLALEYQQFRTDITARIRSAQYEALKAVNREMIALYWEIGKRITEQQALLGWGKSVVETLSKDIQQEFPGIKGFGVSNMWDMARFYNEYHNDKILQPLVAEIHSEYDLEQAIVKNVRAFLTELGTDFSFIGNQYRLEFDGKEYFIDLLLYNRRLQAMVAIELKIGEFKPEYKGKMEFYLNVLNDTVKLPHENPAIGIIICKSKSRLTVEYALKSSTMPIGVATYRLSSELPEDYKNLLPATEQIAQRLAHFLEND